jgi:hypothetical protein
VFTTLRLKWRFRRPQKSRLRCRPRLELLEDRIVLNHTPLGPEFQGNGTPFNSLQPPQVAIASDAAGDFVIAWTEINTSSEGSPTTVKARLFNKGGIAESSDIIVASNLQTPADGFVTVDVAMTPDGQFVVVYDRGEGDLSTVMAHYYSAGSADLGEVEVTPTLSEGFQAAFKPAVARDDAGDVIVAFVDQAQSESPQTIEVQRLDASGNLLGSAMPLSGGDSPLSGPALGADGQGDFVVTWTTNFNQTPEIVFERFSAIGKALDPSPVNVTDTQDNSVSSIGVAHDTGNFVISWTDRTPGDIRVLAERFSSTGTALGSIFQANTNPLNQLASTSVAVDNTGDFVVTWATGPIESQLPASVFARTCNADGSPESTAFKVNQTSFDSGAVDVATDATLHQFVVNWGANGTVDNDVPLSAVRIYRLPDTPPHVMPPPPTPIPTPIPQPVPVPIADPRGFNLAQKPSVKSGNASVLPLFVVDSPRPIEAVSTPFAPLAVSNFPLSSLSPGEREKRLGEIGGRVFLDLNGNGIQDEGEPAVEGMRVFLDMNDNGIHDEGEPEMDTDPNGRYLFTGLALSRYRVRQLVRPPRVMQTSPPQNAAHEVELSWENSSVTGKDFGTKMIVIPVGIERSRTSEPETPSGPPPE